MTEVHILWRFLILGVIITAAYDVMRIMRAIFPRRRIIISIEDLLFWCMSSIIVFQLLYQENNGIVRWFAIMGSVIGMILFEKVIGTYLVKVLSKVGRKSKKIIKKKLTGCIKTVKMMLCKHMKRFRRNMDIEEKV